jgi:hypothetical protein
MFKTVVGAFVLLACISFSPASADRTPAYPADGAVVEFRLGNVPVNDSFVSRRGGVADRRIVGRVPVTARENPRLRLELVYENNRVSVHAIGYGLHRTYPEPCPGAEFEYALSAHGVLAACATVGHHSDVLRFFNPQTGRTIREKRIKVFSGTNFGSIIFVGDDRLAFLGSPAASDHPCYRRGIWQVSEVTRDFTQIPVPADLHCASYLFPTQTEFGISVYDHDTKEWTYSLQTQDPLRSGHVLAISDAGEPVFASTAQNDGPDYLWWTR